MKNHCINCKSGSTSALIRPMDKKDIRTVSKVERNAFPNLFPYTSFRSELSSPKACYLVVCRKIDGYGNARKNKTNNFAQNNIISAFRNWLMSDMRIFLGRKFLCSNCRMDLAGFVGIWRMLNEAHIVSIAVKSEFRGCGLGELLIIGAIEQAMAMKIDVMTLEVRFSNLVAQNLYSKYGFNKVGVRKNYYSNDREDAVIMTTDTINTSNFITRFNQLVELHGERWGQSERLLNK